MKVFALLCLLFVSLEYCLCWTGVPSQDADPAHPSKHIFHFLYVNTEDANGMKVEKLRKIFMKFEDTLLKNIGKWKKEHGDDIPNLLNFVAKDNKKLNSDIKQVVKNVPPLHRANFLKRLNKFLGNLSQGKVESVYFFKNAVGVKVMKGDTTKKKAIKYKVHSSVTIPEQDPKIEMKKIRHMKKKLQKHVKKWTQPSFMRFEDSKEIKKKLKVSTPVNVYTSPGKILLPVKSKVLIQCIASIKHKAHISWENREKIIPVYPAHGKATGDMYVLEDGSLYIKSLKKRNAGTYKCIASSGGEKRFAYALVQVAYLQQFTAIPPVKVFEGTSEAKIKCVPPYGVPVPTVSWMKNGKLINNTRITADSWILVIKNVQRTDAGNYTCYATNMAKQRNVTTAFEVVNIVKFMEKNGDGEKSSAYENEEIMSTLQPDKSEGEEVIENWVGKHFTKPHHLSVDETLRPSNMDILQTFLELSDSNNSLQREFLQNGIGKTLLNGLLEERNELPWEHNDALSKMTEKQKKDYLEAERNWEMQLTHETQRLLDKLQPADAYIIPDLPVFDGVQSKKLEGLDAALVIKKEFEEVAKRKVMMTGNENWDRFDKQDTTSIPTIPKKGGIKVKAAKRSEKKLDSITFENKLADEEEEWLGVEKNAWAKIKNLEKYLNKLKY